VGVIFKLKKGKRKNILKILECGIRDFIKNLTFNAD